MERGRESFCSDVSAEREVTTKRPARLTASGAVLASVLATLPSVGSAVGALGVTGLLSGCSQITHRSSFYAPVNHYPYTYPTNDWSNSPPVTEDLPPSQPETPEPSETPESPIKVKEVFDFATFQPEAEGIVFEKYEAPGSKKTVVYIPDYHNVGKSTGFQNDVHGEIFEIVEGMIEKYGTVPLTVENWVEGRTASTFLDNVSSSNPLYGLFSTEDFGKRKKMAPELIQNGLASGYVLFGTYQDEVLPVGTVTLEDLYELGEVRKKGQQLQKVDYYNKPFCEGTDGRNYSMDAVTRGFKVGNSPQTTHCYCGVHSYEQVIMDVVRDRVRVVPKKEVGKALQIDHSFVVVIAGYKHLNTAKAEMKRRGVNYVVVAPKSLVSELRQNLNADYFKESFPDNLWGTCERMADENSARIAEVVGWIDGL